MNVAKIFVCFLYLFTLLLYIFADNLIPEGTGKDAVLRDACFSLVRKQDEGYKEYNIAFNKSISATDAILSVKKAVEFCANEEKGNRYLIQFYTAENLNKLFFEYTNKDKEQIEQMEQDELSAMYKDFLRKHLSDHGCTLTDSVLITTPDLDCYIVSGGKLCMYSEVCFYCNWEDTTNAAEPEQTE